MFAQAGEAIASRIVVEYPVPPRLALTMFAPLAQAYWNPAETLAFDPLPFPSSTRTGIRLTCQFTPATPIPLFPRAPIVPATCVPCPLKSRGSLSFWTKSVPAITFADRSR